jgi:4-carboxymuconolactone decarboxylase
VSNDSQNAAAAGVSADDVIGDQERYEEGLAIRREVLGDAHVDRSMAKASEFSRPMQELTIEYCWGAIWSRPGLDRRARSILNLGMLTALGRNHELRVHVRGALNNGVTRDEIREVLMQAAIYVGVPAGMESFRAAEGVFDEIDSE